MALQQQHAEMTNMELADPLYSEDPYSMGLDVEESIVRGIENIGIEENGAEDEADLEPPLPEHACAYCGVHDASCVAQCVKTGKWFCNGRISTAASCLVYHLVRSKHKEVRLHRDSPLGPVILECYVTGSRNVFNLGFVPLRSENTVVVLSRTCPPGSPELRDLDLDLQSWQPLIEDRQFVPWLVKIPSQEAVMRARHLSTAQLRGLEAAWSKNPSARLEDIERGEVGTGETEPERVLLRYEDAYHYQNLWAPLVKLEGDHDREIVESQRREGVEVSWEAMGKKMIACFHFPVDDSDMKLGVGDELRLKHGAYPNWDGIGRVIMLDHFGNVELLIANGSACPSEASVNFTVERVWNGTSFTRMLKALSKFAADQSSVSGYLYMKLLGHDVPDPVLPFPVPDRVEAPGLPTLNPSQQTAVRSVMTAPLALIQGPPGTGKTVTSATLVYFLCKLAGEQVLVTAPSNVAVDHLAERISQTGLRVVRMCARSREDGTAEVNPAVRHLTLHVQARNMDLPESKQLKKLIQTREANGFLSEKDAKALFKARSHMERVVLSSAEVVCCTCAGAGDPRLGKMTFRRVIVDEATQASEPESLLPVVMGARQLVLVGDHCQLGPVCLNKAAARAGLNVSLYERLLFMGVYPHRLTVQYRMHPALSAFSSDAFYEGALQNGVSEGARTRLDVDFPWPGPRLPVMFIVNLSPEEMAGSGTSFINRAEASVVERAVTRLLGSGVRPEEIGVITPYEGQRAHVELVMERAGGVRKDLYARVEVASVDAFQGREKDYIILSCVRSNEHQGIGFLREPRRLNVALTRARCGLVVIGNPKVLAKNVMWSSFLTHLRDQGCVVDGPLAQGPLRESMVPFPRQRVPYKYVPDNHGVFGDLEEAFGGPFGGYDAGRAAKEADEPLHAATPFDPYGIPAGGSIG
ncbi:unnamed protein product [Pedinophyceae sp. YPF-701]|nr:unnamed protein product [Pedinophyceae sp. YPF-701]